MSKMKELFENLQGVRSGIDPLRIKVGSKIKIGKEIYDVVSFKLESDKYYVSEITLCNDGTFIENTIYVDSPELRNNGLDGCILSTMRFI